MTPPGDETARFRRLYEDLIARGVPVADARRQVQALYDQARETRRAAETARAQDAPTVTAAQDAAAARGASPLNAQRSALTEALAQRLAGSRLARSFAPEGTRVDQAPGGGATVPRVDAAPTLARLAAQGASFGFSDELRGVFGAGMAAGMLRDPVEGYRASRDAERGALARARQADGVMATTAELAGGAVSTVPGATATLARAGGGVARRMLAGANVGARAGALAGAGASEAGVDDLPGLARDVAAGTAGGAVAGAAVPGAATLLERGAEAVAPAVMRAARSLPGASVRARLASPAPADPFADVSAAGVRRAAAAFADDLAPGAEPAEAMRELARRVGRMEPTEMLMDQGGRNVRGLVAATEATPGAARTRIGEALDTRQRTQAKRAVRTVANVLGLRPSGDLVGEATAQAEAIRRAARPVYDRAMFTPEGTPRTVDAQLFEAHAGKPAFRRALVEARELAANDGVQLPASIVEGVQAPNGGTRLVLVNPTLEQAHYVKVALDKAAETAAPSEARILRRLARDFRESLYQAVPDYREAQAMWATAERQQEALDAGVGALRKAPAEIRRALAAMSEPERLLYRTAAMEDLRAMVGRLAEDRDATRQLTTPDMRRRLLALAPDRASYKRLARWLAGEVRQAETRAATKGSRTVPLANDQAALADALPPSTFLRAAHAVTRPVETAQRGASRLAEAMDLRARVRAAEDLAPLLTARRDQAPAAVSALSDALVRQRLGAPTTRATGAAAGAAARGAARGGN